jgi:hypothetical protein
MHTRGFHGWIQLLLLINNNNNNNNNNNSSRLHVSIYRIKNRCHIMYILILYQKNTRDKYKICYGPKGRSFESKEGFPFQS